MPKTVNVCVQGRVIIQLDLTLIFRRERSAYRNFLIERDLVKRAGRDVTSADILDIGVFRPVLRERRDRQEDETPQSCGRELHIHNNGPRVIW